MKTKIYSIIFLLLIGFGLYTIYSKSVDEKMQKRDRDFKIEKFNELSEIKIFDKQGRKMSLKNDNGSWILNDKYPVREHLFLEMKEALTKMEAFNPVANVATEIALTEMIQHAIKVEIYRDEEQAEKVIYIGGPNYTNTASNMFLEFDGVVSNKIYEVGIPGFRGYLTTRFLINEDDWRSKKICSFEPNEFKKIDIKYFNNHGKTDFSLSKNINYQLEIEGENYKSETLNETAIINYILVLKEQFIMSYAFQNAEEQKIKDSLLLTNKYAKIVYTDINDITTSYTIVDMPLSDRSKKQFDINGDFMTYDIDYKYIIFGEDAIWGVFDMKNFGKLFLDPEKFLNKSPID